MTTNIQLLRSAIANKRPDPKMLLEGQAAINTSPDSGSAGLYFALSDDSLVKVGPVGFSPISPPNTNAAGSPGNGVGEEWVDTSPNYFQPVQKVYNGNRWISSNGFLTDDNTGDFTLSKTMFLRTLDVRGKAQHSYIRVPQDNYDARRIIDGAAGMFRFNNDEQTLKFEGHDGTKWVQFATGGGSTTLEHLELTGDLQSSGNVDLCSNCNDDFRVRGQGLFDCGVSITGGLNVKGDATIQGSQVTFNTNLSDKTYINGGLTTSGDSEFQRSLVVGRLGNTSVFTANCPSYLLEDTRIGIDTSHKLLVSAVSEFREFADLRNDVKIGDTISNDLLINSTTRFRGHVELGDPLGSSNFDVYAQTTFLKDVFFQENVTVGSDSSDSLTVKSTANFQNDVTVGQQATDTLQVLANLVQVSDADFKENVIIGTDPFDELTVNATSVFNASVQLGSEASQVVHVKAAPKFHTNIVPSTNLGSSLGEADTRFGDMHIHNGSATGKLVVHELEVQHKTSFETDLAIGFDELHDFEVKATTLFTAPVGFERDVFIGDGSDDLLTVDSTANFNAPVALLDTLFVDKTFTINDNVLPNIDDSYDLGSSALRWQNVYGVNSSFSGTVSIGTLAPLDHLLQSEDLRVVHSTHLGTDDLDDLTVDATLRQNSVAFFGDDVTIGDDSFDELFINSTAALRANTSIGQSTAIAATNLDVYSTSYFYSNIFPDADASVDIGSVHQRWKDIYGLNAHLTHNLDVGSNCGDMMTVHAKARFKCDVIVDGNLLMGDTGDFETTGDVDLNTDCSDTTTINGVLKSKCDVILNEKEGNTDIKGELDVQQPTTLHDTLSVGSNATIAGDVLPLNTLSHNLGSTTNLWSSLYVSDGEVLHNLNVGSGCSDQMTVDAVAHFKCDVVVDGNLSMGGAGFDFGGNINFNSDCGDLTTINGRLISKCDVTLNDTSGDTLIKGGLTVNEDVFFEKSLSVDLDTSILQNLTVGGQAIITGHLDTGSTAVIADTLFVGNDTTVRGDVLPATAINSHKIGTSAKRWSNLFADTGTITNGFNIGSGCSDKLTVNAIGDFKCNVSIGGDITNSGLSTSGNNATLNNGCGDSTVIKGKLDADCSVVLNKSQGNTEIKGGLTVQKDATFNNSCSDTTLIKGKFDANCAVVLNKTQGNTEAKGELTVQKDTTLNKTLYVGGLTTVKGNVMPHSTNAYNLGSSSVRWANLYTNDLHLSNEGLQGGNSVDGTWGDWTIQEGEDALYMINNRNGQAFKINMTPV